MNPLQEYVPVSYAGYRADRRGASVWPQATPRYRWEELTAIRTARRADRSGFETLLVFQAGRKWQLGGARAFSFGHSLGRYAEVLALACAGAPASAKIDELTREIAEWGPRAVRTRLRAEAGRLYSADDLMQQARNHRAWLEPNKALKATEAALQREPGHRAALKLRLQLLLESASGRDKPLAAARRWLEASPQEAEAQSVIFGLGLDANDPATAEPAFAWLREHPDDLRLAFALSGFHFRRKAYAQAVAALESARPAADDADAPEALRRQIEFIRRYAAGGRYRAWYQTKKWTLLVLPWVFLALFVAIKLAAAYHWWERRHPAPPTPALREELGRVREKLAAMEREMQELTGLVSGEFPALKKRADAGEAAAQYTVADRYFDGSLGAPKDEAAGLRYLELAAAQHYLHAVRDLADRLDESIQADDRARAIRLYEEAARLGSGRAAALLARRYHEGKGVEKNPAKGFAWSEQGAANGNVDAMELAGWALERGEGVEKNRPRALEYYRRAAAKNSAWAAERLVAGLYRPNATGDELNECWKWTLAGAKDGSKELRRFMAGGIIVAGNIVTEQERRQAFEWTRESAEAGEAEGEGWLSQFYWLGIAVPQDQRKAVEWLAKAAAQKHAPSLQLLAECQAFGVAVPQDLTAARANRAVLAAELKGEEKRLGELDQLLEIAAKPSPPVKPGGDQPARAIWRRGPRYPEVLRREGVTGEAVVEFYVNEDGFTRDLKVVRASRPEFGYAAVNALSFWRFEPAVEQGVRVRRLHQQLLTFTLNDDPEPAAKQAPAGKNGN
ncbi:MAG: TonB family protein [Verrucomicrobia bacterium]|nr:TonB family protein [Verrucomicrobiota bacterium]